MTIRSVLRAFAVCGLALLMLACGAACAFAGPDIEVYVDGGRVEFPDQKPFIDSRSGRTYVPLRFVSEALGGFVHWDGGARAALISTDRGDISMPVNSQVARVDGKDIVLDAPALLTNGRTYVPLRFVSAALGAAVEWVGPAGGRPGRVLVTTGEDSENRNGSGGEREETVKAPWTLTAGESDGRTHLRIESPAPLTHKVFTMTGPDRLVIDLAGAGADVPADIEPGTEAVRRIRTGFSENPPTGRVVCDLAGGLGFTRYRVEAGADRRSLEVQIWTVDNPLEGRIIVLDPGHGGADPGATGPGGLREKDVNLDVAWKTARLLREEGVEVVMTRTGDVRLGATAGQDLEARSRIANSSGADLFISLHCNASLSRTSNGTSVYYHAHPVNSAQNAKLARAVQDSLVRALGRKNLGAVSCNFYVLKYTDMPGVLVETAFLSNPEEERLLGQDWFRAQVAAAVVEGIRNYYVIS